MKTNYTYRLPGLFWSCIMMGFLFIECKQKHSEVNNKISNVEIVQIKQIIKDYEKGWVTDDSALILSLFSDKAILIPSGMQPIEGKNAIIKFWWPADRSKTIINKYTIDLLEIEGNGDLAYAFENGSLSWSYEKGATKFSKDQQSYEVTIFKKNAAGKWEIVKRIWTDVNK